MTDTDLGQSDPDRKLVRMANQIADFFRAQRDLVAAEAIAGHINDYWPPIMREDLRHLLTASDLTASGPTCGAPCSDKMDSDRVAADPLVMAALPLIRRPGSGAGPDDPLPSTASEAQPGA